MKRITAWMFWAGMALLFGAGLLAGLALAQPAEAETRPEIASRCAVDWARNSEMYAACVRVHTEAHDALGGHARISPETASRVSNPTLPERCAADWGTNYMMRAACERVNPYVRPLRPVPVAAPTMPVVAPPPPVAPPAVWAEAVQAACTKYYPDDRRQYTACVINLSR
jgi:hypothetical protein